MQVALDAEPALTTEELMTWMGKAGVAADDEQVRNEAAEVVSAGQAYW